MRIRNKVFVSYSHNDSDWLRRLQIHLRILDIHGQIELWDDTKIKAGTLWREEVSAALNSASVAVLLISADFLASDFIIYEELPRLLAAAEKNELKILPVIISPSRFDKIESLSKFQSINPLSMPLIKLSKAEQEEYWVKLSDAVFIAVEEAGKILNHSFRLHYTVNDKPFIVGENETIKAREGDALLLRSFEVSLLVGPGSEAEIAAEAYLRKPEIKTEDHYDYRDGRFTKSVRAIAHLRSGEFYSKSKSASWVLQNGWDKLVIALIEYSPGGHRIMKRYRFRISNS
jgi:TIR domain